MTYAETVKYCHARSLTSITENTLRREVKLQRIRHFRNGRVVDIQPSAVDAWIQKKMKGPAL